MAETALRKKLEEKLTQNEDYENEIIEEPNNIIPFAKQEMGSIVPEFAITLSDAKERIRMLQEFIKEMMIEGVDYGIIPKCDKPSLFKSGAEKLTDIFGFTKQVEITNRLEDWKEGIFHYEVKAILISKRTGLVEAEGIGSCNNREKKYINQHSFSVINTVLKMAKKRALIDAVLSATRSSAIFTQDVEDMEPFDNANPGIYKDQGNSEGNPNYEGNSKNKSTNINSKQVISGQSFNPNSQRQPSTAVNTSTVKPATKSQLNKIQTLVTEKNIPINKIKSVIYERYQVNESKLLSLKQADDLIKYIINN